MKWIEAGRRGLLLGLVVVLGLSAPAADGEAPPLRLLDSKGAPVARALVTVVGRTGAVVTDADGFFHLSPEPSPPFELAVFSETGSWLGRIRVERLATEGVRNLLLPPVEKVEVTVHGGVAPSTPAPPAAAATVISEVENEQRRPPRLVEVLDEVPGAGNLGSGHAAVPSLRGLARGRTLLLLDDGRVTSERRAGASASYLDPFLLETVEVVRGPGSVTYGSDALGGVIHARTPSPQAGNFGGRFEAMAGAGQEVAGGGIEVNVPAGDGALLVAVHARRFDDYDSPLAEVPDSGSRDRGLLLKALVPGERTRWMLGFQSNRVYDTGKPRIGADDVRTVYPTEESDRLTLSAGLPAMGRFEDVQLRAFLGRYRLVTDRERLPSPGVTRQIFRSDVEADDASLRLVAAGPLDRGALKVGLDVHGRFDLHADGLRIDFDDEDRVADKTVEEAIDSARQIAAGLFVEAERTLGAGRSSVAGGVRGEWIGQRNSGGSSGTDSRDDSSLSGYLAYTFRPAQRWSAVVQVARGFREPTLSDRYFTGVTGRGFITGNPDLRPETSRQLDVSVQRTGTLVRFAAYGYLYRIEDLVERFRDPAADDRFLFRNRREEEVRGLEVESDVNLGKSFSARFTLSWARGEFRDDGTAPDDIPPLGGSLSIHHRPVPKIWWRLGYGLFARDDREGPNEAPTPGYGVVDLSAGLSLAEGLEARLLLGNLFDKVYPASPDDDSVLAPGIHATLVLAGRF